jgi:putative ATP-dependent endonuclease of the OLD family
MRLTHLHIKNFRSCRDVILEVGEIHALVGANNSGKSSVLRALDFLFNPSTKNLNEESFWNKDTSLEIRVEAVFSDLTEKEKEALGPYLRVDGTFHMARSAKLGGTGGESEADAEPGDDKITIGQQCKQSVPEPEWLRDSCINGKNITEWWKNKVQLVSNGVSFADSWVSMSKKPSVEEWKVKRNEFVEAHASSIHNEGRLDRQS